jgi:hypothetical protein
MFSMIASYVASEDAFHCRITDVVLNLKDRHDPFYRHFVQLIPGDRKTLLMVGAMPGMLKSDLTLDELLTVVPELHDHRTLGRPFKKDIIPFIAWHRGLPIPTRFIAPITPPFKATGYTCAVCIRPRDPGATYCPRCRQIILLGRQWPNLDKKAALIESYDPALDGFLCTYTGILLEEINYHLPYFLVFDHQIPGQKKLVVAASWVNHMKGWLTHIQFWNVIAELTNHIRTGEPFDTGILNRSEWKHALYMKQVHGRQIC